MISVQRLERRKKVIHWVCLDKCAVIAVMVNAMLLGELLLIRCLLEMNDNRYFE